jgi:ABC-type Fe3+/spermidine/putrescine transport system ATPase subunit
VIVVRPEMVELDQPEAELEGVVRIANYLGDVVEYDVEVGGQLLALVEKDPRHTTIHPEGETVSLHFLEDCLYVLPE